MPYYTTALNHSSNYVLTAILATGNCACTILSFKSSGAVSSESLISPNGSRSIANGLTRMMFIVNAPQGATGVFTITQGGLTLADLAIGGSNPVDLTITFEVS